MGLENRNTGVIRLMMASHGERKAAQARVFPLAKLPPELQHRIKSDIFRIGLSRCLAGTAAAASNDLDA